MPGMITFKCRLVPSTKLFTAGVGLSGSGARRHARAGLIACLLLAGLPATRAQEQLPREEALKYALVACVNLKEMLQTPIPTDPDVKRPVAVRDGEYGGVVLPETRLSAETLAKVGKDVTPVGQLWMVKLVPMSEDQAVPLSKMRVVHLKSEDKEADAVCCALGVRKDAKGDLELLIYGKDKEPVLRAPLKAISAPQDNPIEMSGERKDNGGLVTLKLVGKYEASFMVTDPER
jgi:hypothetical protein